MNTNTIVNFNLPFANTVDQNFQKEMQYINQCKDGILFEGSRIAVAKPKVSIVIPVYNKVKYLDLALRSAQNQTMRDLEIICVDDGSIDGSIEKIESYMKDDHRIRLVNHEKNEGTLKARCDGVRAAKGEFIMPLDADDAFCNPEIAELAYNKAKEVGADIVQFRTIKCDDNVLSESKWGGPVSFNSIEKQNLFKEFLKFNIRHCVWGNLIARDVYLGAYNLLGEDFIGEKISCNEDLPQMLVCFKLAKRYIGLNSIGYMYIRNADGVTHNVFKQNDKGFIAEELSNKRLNSWILNFTRFIELLPDEYRDDLCLYFLKIIKGATPSGVAISCHKDRFIKLSNAFLSDDSVSSKNKIMLRKFLQQINDSSSEMLKIKKL